MTGSGAFRGRRNNTRRRVPVVLLAILCAALGSAPIRPGPQRPEASASPQRPESSISPQQPESSSPRPPDAPATPAAQDARGMVERTGVTLILLEVEAVDRDGRPMRGLTREDFSLRLDGRPWPVATLDDYCAPAPPEPGRVASAGSGPPAARPAARGPAAHPAGEAAASPPARSDRFVLFLDFNEMTMSGRAEALREARRWVKETKHPDDEAMLAAYGSKMGLEILQDFTADRDALAGVIDGLVDDRRTIDHFPNEFLSRIEECDDDPRTCIHSARQEYWNGRQSLTALQRLLARLETTPGRKHLILFHQNGMLFPGEAYGVPAGDHVHSTNQIGAIATAAQTAIHTARVGGEGRVPALPAAARALGTRFAEGTGGRANRGAGDLRAVLAAAGSRNRCLYVLGIEPPLQPDASRIYTARIAARGVALPALLQVQFRTGARWLLTAAAILDDPSRARDVPLAAAIVPLAARRGRWTVAVQVVVEEDALLQLPASPDRSRDEWEVGAILRLPERGSEWEMLATSTLTRPTDLRARPVLLHEHQLSGLRPGAYRLTAFVRDRNANIFGGAEARLTLPDPRAGGAAGPLLVHPGLPRIVSALPPTGGHPAPESAGRHDTGTVPAAAPTLSPGEPAALLVWLCPGARAAAAPSSMPRRYLAREDVPVFRLPDVAPEAAGDCFALEDAIPGRALGPGRYVYTLEWEHAARAVRLEQPIEVVAPRRVEGNR